MVNSSAHTNSTDSTRTRFTRFTGNSTLTDKKVAPVVPVTVTLETKPEFMRLVESFGSIDDLSEENIRLLVEESRKPQTVEVKVREIYPKDHAALWELVNSNDGHIRSLVEKAVKENLGNHYTVSGITYREGCVIITFILSVVPAAQLLVTTLQWLTTVVVHWDVIEKNLPKIRTAIKRTYQNFTRFTANVVMRIKNWFNSSGGENFAY